MTCWRKWSISMLWDSEEHWAGCPRFTVMDEGFRKKSCEGVVGMAGWENGYITFYLHMVTTVIKFGISFTRIQKILFMNYYSTTILSFLIEYSESIIQYNQPVPLQYSIASQYGTITIPVQHQRTNQPTNLGTKQVGRRNVGVGILCTVVLVLWCHPRPLPSHSLSLPVS